MCATCQERGTGELYTQGDEACEQGDLAMLAQIAIHLSEHVPEPLHCEIVALARRCADRKTATDAWDQLKKRLHGASMQP